MTTASSWSVFDYRRRWRRLKRAALERDGFLRWRARYFRGITLYAAY